MFGAIVLTKCGWGKVPLPYHKTQPLSHLSPVKYLFSKIQEKHCKKNGIQKRGLIFW